LLVEGKKKVRPERPAREKICGQETMPPSLLALVVVLMVFNVEIALAQGVMSTSNPNLLLFLLGPTPNGAVQGYLSPKHPLYNYSSARTAMRVSRPQLTPRHTQATAGTSITWPLTR
jgi:hypothetical protein